eukprot:XP_001692484.1 predicted protein [Chlamydomonas reinhardtii]
MGQGCSGKFVDMVTEDEALKTVRKDSFKKATNDLNHAGGIVERLGGADRVHDVIQAFYRKLFQNAMVRHYFENLSSDRMRSKQMKFMRYIMGGPGTYTGNLRCIHAQMVKEEGLDKAKFQVVIGMLLDTFKELNVPQDVVSEILGHVESAKSAIFTPQPDELVTPEELVAAAADLGRSCPLVAKLGGPEPVQGIITAFYRRLFSSEELKYFFVGLSTERLRTMQFRFMRYLLAGPGWYATTGGNMRCVHARMIAEGGLDLPKFQAVTGMLRAACDEHLVSPPLIREIMLNVKAAEQAIFTPGPDELMSREEFEAELAALESEEAARLAEHKESGGGGGLPGQPQEQDGEQRGPPTGLVRRVGGPEAAYELVRRLYSRLFADEVLKGFFAGLSVERLKTKQDVCADLLTNVESARTAIFTPSPGEGDGSASFATPTPTNTTTTNTSSGSSIYERLGGEEVLCDLVDMWAGKLGSDPALAHIYSGGVDMPRQRAHQLAFLRQAFGGSGGGGASRPGSAACPALGGTAGAAGGMVGAMRLEIAAAHLARDKALAPAQFERIADHLTACLKKEGASPELVAEVRAMQGPGRCLLWPPSSAAAPAAACPFAASLLGDEVPPPPPQPPLPQAPPAVCPRLSAAPTNMTSYDERALDAIVSATPGDATAATAAVGNGSSNSGAGPAAPSRPASGVPAAAGAGSSSLSPSGSGKATGGGLTKSDFVRRPSVSSNTGGSARPSADLAAGAGSRPGTASTHQAAAVATGAAAAAPVPVRGASVSSTSSAAAAAASAASAVATAPATGAVAADGLFGEDDEELMAAMERAAGLQQPEAAMARAGSVRA